MFGASEGKTSSLENGVIFCVQRTQQKAAGGKWKKLGRLEGHHRVFLQPCGFEMMLYFNVTLMQWQLNYTTHL